MRQRLNDLIAWSKTHEGRKLIRFTSVSVISTIVSNATLFIVYGLKIIKGEVYATVFGNLVATLPSYYLNRTWTWGKTGRSHLRREIIPFWSMSLLGITFSMLGAEYARHLVHAHPHWMHLVKTIVVVGANFVSFAVFWVLKLKVFNRIFHVNELHDVDEHLTVEERQAF